MANERTSRRASGRTPALIVLFSLISLNSLIMAGVVTSRLSANQAAMPADRLAMRDAVRELTTEALDVRAGGVLPETADFADRFGRVVDAADLQRAIAERAHRDDFVDAYIRWQLTSFDFALEALDDASFARLMNGLPPLTENPRAEPELVRLLERADGAGPLSESDATRLREVVATLGEQTETVERLNRPALELRLWIAEQVDPAQSSLCLIEQCAATVAGGWSTRAIKTEITRRFTAAATDAGLTEADRQTLAAAAERLAGRSRRFVRNATFFADGSVTASFSTAGVDRGDVRGWTDRLFGRDS